MKYILTCNCFRQDKKAMEAFSLLFPSEPCPGVIKGKDRISKLANELGNEHMKAISKLSGKFAYYVNVEGGKITEEYDLIRGSKIA